MTSGSTVDDGMSIGIALSSGGAGGLAHVGVLEELTAAGLHVRWIAGTSAGAIVGAAFAAQQLEAFRDWVITLTRRNRLALFDPIWPRAGLLAGQRAMIGLRPFFGSAIEELPVRFAAVATDLYSARRVVLERGDVIEAVRASIAIPGIFTPVLRQGRLLVDGALTDPLPVGVTRNLGAKFVVAVNVIPASATASAPAVVAQPGTMATLWRWIGSFDGSTMTPAGGEEVTDLPGQSVEATNGSGSLMDILSQASAVVQANLVAARLRDEPPDFCIAPEVGEVGLFDLHRAADAIECGRAAARAILPELLEKIRSAQPRVRSVVRPGLRHAFSRRVRALAAA